MHTAPRRVLALTVLALAFPPVACAPAGATVDELAAPDDDGGADDAGSGEAATPDSASTLDGAKACTTAGDCDDGVYCNGVEVCDPQRGCVAAAAPPCDDGVACTEDTCDEAGRRCVHTPDDQACQNGSFCDGAEVCLLQLGCRPGTPPSCDDDIACTTDACDAATDACTHAPVDAACDDGLFCTGAETCVAGVGCTPGVTPACDDGVACTTDACSATTDACVHVPLDTACSDGVFCNGLEKCDPATGATGTGCTAGVPVACDDGVPCTDDACDEAALGCAFTPVDARCDDGAFCNGAERCTADRGCVAGVAPSCDDGLGCTSDSCSDAQRACLHAPVDAACDDGRFCNGQETCDPAGTGPTGCRAGAPFACASDGVACTVDACDETTRACTHTATNSLCPAGQFCVLQQGGCTTGSPCATAADCQDGDLCNGVEACVGGACRPGTAVSCDDHVACTIDACDPATGACSHAAKDALCDDGKACDGVERCDAAAGCVAGTAVACDDGVACTIDACLEPSGTCAHEPLDGLCSDGVLCNGIETCDPVAGCKTTPYVCPDDGVACTREVCDPLLDACKPVPDDTRCGCGQTCDATLGCGKFCTVRTCQGKVYACGNCVDDDGDCRIDSGDDMCLGPCDNTEASFYGGIPGQNNAPCKQDCYFDGDTGAGNDACYWSLSCDPYEVAPAYSPGGSKCGYSANASIPGTSASCSQLSSSQSSTCGSYCGPLTPNGCDCFGCCAIPGAPTPVWLGSESGGSGSCTTATLNDPTRCKPCTQVPSCLNTCEHCELCVGKTTLPLDCVSQTCPAGVTPCGLPGQAACPAGLSCITGCCQSNPD